VSAPFRTLIFTTPTDQDKFSSRVFDRLLASNLKGVARPLADGMWSPPDPPPARAGGRHIGIRFNVHGERPPQAARFPERPGAVPSPIPLAEDGP
jgi:hypothetical protein